MTRRVTRSDIEVAAGFTAVTLVLALTLGFVLFSHINGMEKSCDDAFGEGSSWVGEAEAYGDDRIVCETPGGDLRLAAGGPRELNADALSDYFDWIADQLR